MPYRAQLRMLRSFVVTAFGAIARSASVKKLEQQTIIIVRRVTFKDEGLEMALVLGICQ